MPGEQSKNKKNITDALQTDYEGFLADIAVRDQDENNYAQKLLKKIADEDVKKFRSKNPQVEKALRIELGRMIISHEYDDIGGQDAFDELVKGLFPDWYLRANLIEGSKERLGREYLTSIGLPWTACYFDVEQNQVFIGQTGKKTQLPHGLTRDEVTNAYSQHPLLLAEKNMHDPQAKRTEKIRYNAMLPAEQEALGIASNMEEGQEGLTTMYQNAMKRAEEAIDKVGGLLTTDKLHQYNRVIMHVHPSYTTIDGQGMYEDPAVEYDTNGILGPSDYETATNNVMDKLVQDIQHDKEHNDNQGVSLSYLLAMDMIQEQQAIEEFDEQKRLLVLVIPELKGMSPKQLGRLTTFLEGIANHPNKEHIAIIQSAGSTNGYLKQNQEQKDYDMFKKWSSQKSEVNIELRGGYINGCQKSLLECLWNMKDRSPENNMSLTLNQEDSSFYTTNIQQLSTMTTNQIPLPDETKEELITLRKDALKKRDGTAENFPRWFKGNNELNNAITQAQMHSSKVYQEYTKFGQVQIK